MNTVYSYITFENLIWECTDESLEQARNMINLFDQKTVLKLIYHVSTFRPLSFKQLGDLFELCGPTAIVFPNFYMFSRYLYVRGLLNESNFSTAEGPPSKSELLPIEKYEEPIKQNTLQHAVMQNNVIGLSELQGETDLNRVFIDVLDMPFTLPSLAAFCGSLDVLQYMKASGVIFDVDIALAAVEGGHKDVIAYLMEEGIEFDYNLETAIKWHNNEAAKYLIENTECEEIKLPLCIESYNTDMHMYFIDVKGKSMDDYEYYRDRIEFYLSNHSNEILHDFILQ